MRETGADKDHSSECERWSAVPSGDFHSAAAALKTSFVLRSCAHSSTKHLFDILCVKRQTSIILLRWATANVEHRGTSWNMVSSSKLLVPEAPRFKGNISFGKGQTMVATDLFTVYFLEFLQNNRVNAEAETVSSMLRCQ